MATQPTAEELWHALLSGQMSWARDRRRFQLIPARHRCKNCNAPLTGFGAVFMRFIGRGRYKRNPRFCEF